MYLYIEDGQDGAIISPQRLKEQISIVAKMVEPLKFPCTPFRIYYSNFRTYMIRYEGVPIFRVNIVLSDAFFPELSKGYIPLDKRGIHIIFFLFLD